jgi:hypothetical protein
MLKQVEDVTGKEWARAIAPLSGFSEYILYGVYVTRVLGSDSGHWNDGTIRTLNHWRPVPLDLGELRKFKATREPHHHSVMVSAKSRTREADIREVFFGQPV